MGRMNPSPTHSISRRALVCAMTALCATALLAENANTRSNPRDNSAATTTTTDSTRPLKHTDRTFVERAAESGRDEVAIARIAAERATSPDVKKFAQMLVDDHTRANDELTSLANAKNVKLKAKEKSEDKWSKKDPNALDRDFVKQMISDHKKDIKLFTKESQDGSDSELVEFARKTLPTLNHHLEAASELEKTVR